MDTSAWKLKSNWFLVFYRIFPYHRWTHVTFNMKLLALVMKKSLGLWRISHRVNVQQEMQFFLLRKTNIQANCALNLDGIWFFLCSLELLKDHYFIGIYKNIHRITTFVNIMGIEPESKVHLVETIFRESKTM